MTSTMTALSATDAAFLNDMKNMSFDHEHDYDDDAASDSTITAIAKDPITEKPGADDWMYEIEHSFESCCNGLLLLDDFNVHHHHHQTIIFAPHINQRSKFSVIKQKVKRVFSTAKPLPVLPTTTTTTTITTTGSTDSSISSSSTVRPPADQYSAHSNESSCGDDGSFSFTKLPRKRYSTVSRMKNRFSRIPSSVAPPSSSSSFSSSPPPPPLPIKGILKTRKTTANGIGWSKARFSIYGNSYTVLSLNNNKRKSLAFHVKKSRVLRFNEIVDMQETFTKEDYDRSSDTDAVCSRLTPMKAEQIKQELNNFKLYEMVVADESRNLTHFFLQ